MGFSTGVKIGATRLSGGVVADLVQGDAPMTDAHDLSACKESSLGSLLVCKIRYIRRLERLRC